MVFSCSSSAGRNSIPTFIPLIRSKVVDIISPSQIQDLD
jgi:hypothetical protein